MVAVDLAGSSATVRISPERFLLLKSAVHPNVKEASDAWRQLVSRFGSETDVLSWCNGGGGGRRLLPLFVSRGKQLGMTAESISTCHDAQVEAWGLNQRLFVECESTIAAICDAGHSLMCIKGNALFGDVYNLDQSRALGDVDLVVHPESVRDVVAILAAHDWTPQGNPDFYTRLTRRGIRGIHAVDFFLPSGNSIDLHVRPAQDLRMTEKLLKRMWNDADPVSEKHPFSRFGVLRPSSEMQLLIIAANVTRFDLGNPAHPLADFCNIVEASTDGRIGSIKGHQLVEMAQNLCVLTRLKATVDLARGLGYDVPVGATSWVYEDKKLNRIEQQVLRVDRLVPDFKEPGARGSFRRAMSRVVRVTMGGGPFSKIAAFVVVALETGRTKWQNFPYRVRRRHG